MPHCTGPCHQGRKPCAAPQACGIPLPEVRAADADGTENFSAPWPLKAWAWLAAAVLSLFAFVACVALTLGAVGRHLNFF